MTSSARPNLARALAWLTASRIVAGPAIAALILWTQAAGGAREAAFTAGFMGLAAALFVVAAATDWLDGALARRWGAVTPLGAALDHAADKALVAPVLVALAFGALPIDLTFAACLLVARDVAVAGLREGLSHAGRALPVSRLGKAKAAAEMSGVALVLALPALGLAAPQALGFFEALARLMLWGAAALALWSGALYLRASFTSL